MAEDGGEKRSLQPGSPLTPRVCEMLVALERYRNMGETAFELGVLQPVLSRQLAGVEKSLGVSLFARTTRSIEPTNEGLVVVREAATILASLDRITGDLDSIARGNYGLIRLGVASVAAAVLAPQAVAALQVRHPKVSFSVRDDTSERLLDDLTLGRLDAAILRLPEEGHFQLEKVELYDEPIRILARGRHPLAGKTSVDWQDLSTFQWILPPSQFAMRQQIERLFDADGLTFASGVLETLSVPFIIGLLGATDAIAPVADSLARRCVQTENFSILPIECPLRLEPVSLVWRKESIPSPVMEKFIQTTVAVAKKIGAAAS